MSVTDGASEKDGEEDGKDVIEGSSEKEGI
jgi:hypothetical protein